MVKIIIALSVLLILSMVFNGFLAWYVKTTLAKLLFIAENLSFLKNAVGAYSKHLKSVYQLEPFYGDETIKFLFEHSNALLDKFDEFNDVIALSDEQEIILDDREIEIISDTPADDEETSSKTLGAPQEKHVLYGGTRRSNR